MGVAIKVEGLGKRFLLGETFERTLTSRMGQLLRGRLRTRPALQEEFWALRDVGFEIAEGEAVGIIGGNGAGKSTLLKILSRITPPTEGRARVKGRLSSLLEVGTGFHPELTGRENVFLNGAILGMRTAEVERKFDEIVAFSGVEKFIDTPVKRYSSGMYVRLAFAVAAHLEPDVLIIDEVLAVGDAEFQSRCLGKMNDVASAGRTVLFVSHNMAAVQKLCGRGIWLREGRVHHIGSANETVAAYLEREMAQGSGSDLAPGFLYEAGNAGTDTETRVLAVEMLDESGSPLRKCSTWDSVRFRITYRIGEPHREFSVALNVSSADGQRLILTSTAPDHGMRMRGDPGVYRIECAVRQLPLTSGTYALGINLAVPRVNSIWKNETLCRLEVGPRDVFNAGFYPAAPRYLVAAENEWAPPTCLTGPLPR